MTQMRELLDQQKDFYRTLLEQQEKSFKTCVQIIVDSSKRRIDDLSKQVYDFKVSLEMTQKVFYDFKLLCKTWSKNSNETRADLELDLAHRTGKPTSSSGKPRPRWSDSCD